MLIDVAQNSADALYGWEFTDGTCCLAIVVVRAVRSSGKLERGNQMVIEENWALNVICVILTMPT